MDDPDTGTSAPAQYKKDLGNSYQRALLELRKRHDDEFRSLLMEQYELRGLKVVMRRSRITKEIPN